MRLYSLYEDHNDKKKNKGRITTDREDTEHHKECQITNRRGEIRTVKMRTFENSNRRSHKYAYPKYIREALPPTRR